MIIIAHVCVKREEAKEAIHLPRSKYVMIYIAQDASGVNTVYTA